VLGFHSAVGLSLASSRAQYGKHVRRRPAPIVRVPFAGRKRLVDAGQETTFPRQSASSCLCGLGGEERNPDRGIRKEGRSNRSEPRGRGPRAGSAQPMSANPDTSFAFIMV